MSTTVSREDALRALSAPGADFELTEEVVRGVPMRVFRNAPASLRAVLEATREFAERDAVVYERERFTYAELLAVTRGLAARFKERYGLEPGDRIAVAMRNYPEWPLVFWAAIAAGLVVVPLNAWWTAAELRYAIEDSGARLLVADGERMEVLGDQLAELPLRGVIAVRPAAELAQRAEGWEEVRAELDLDASLPDVNIEPDDDATILYTSGTMGTPKGAIGTHRNHVTNLMNTALNGALGLTMAGGEPPEEQPVYMTTFPIFHIAGQTGMQFSALSGSKLVLLYRWDNAKALEMIERERVSSLAAVPKTVRRLLDSPELAERNLSSLTGLASGGAPVPPDLILQVDRQFASAVAPANGYGLTETTSAVVVNSGEEYVEHPDSVGRPVVGSDLRVVDPGTGKDVPHRQVGELWVRGPNVVRGYWNKPNETAESFTDGWFHTGDLGYVDDDGLVYVVDRLKDVVIRGGENVYCAEVEATLFEHPAVEDVAVVGLPDELLGEEVAAIVNLREGASAGEGQLRAHAAERLARFKVPGVIVLRGEPLPRTATGKVLKRDLREELVRAPREELVRARPEEETDA
jgi:acyl-CoA synthetase (AMP-forming)/AMP-acid ligase II